VIIPDDFSGSFLGKRNTKRRFREPAMKIGSKSSRRSNGNERALDQLALDSLGQRLCPWAPLRMVKDLFEILTI